LEDSLTTLLDAQKTNRSSKDNEKGFKEKVQQEEKALDARKEETQEKENAIKMIGESVKTMLCAFENSSLASMATQKH